MNIQSIQKNFNMTNFNIIKSLVPLFNLISKLYYIPKKDSILPIYNNVNNNVNDNINKNIMTDIIVNNNTENKLSKFFKNISLINLDDSYSDNKIHNNSETQKNSLLVEKNIFSISEKIIPTFNNNTIFNKKTVNIKVIRELINDNNGYCKINSCELFNKTKFDKNNIISIKDYNEFMVYQPFGSQKFPDFLYVIYKDNYYIFQSIEIKSSFNGVATWNGSYPKENCIYIFYDYTLNKITYFMGNIYMNSYIRSVIKISEQSIDVLIKFFNKFFEDNGIMWKKVHYKKTEHINVKRYVKDDKNDQRMRDVEQYISKLY